MYGKNEQIREILGIGEVEIQIDALGPTLIQETAFPGVWWLEHRNADDVLTGRYIEITAVPALVAGVKEIALMSPPRFEGGIHPVILAVCEELGIEEVYRMGGAHGVAALPTAQRRLSRSIRSWGRAINGCRWPNARSTDGSTSIRLPDPVRS